MSQNPYTAGGEANINESRSVSIEAREDWRTRNQESPERSLQYGASDGK